jgi:hypothetical protein
MSISIRPNEGRQRRSVMCPASVNGLPVTSSAGTQGHALARMRKKAFLDAIAIYGSVTTAGESRRHPPPYASQVGHNIRRKFDRMLELLAKAYCPEFRKTMENKGRLTLEPQSRVDSATDLPSASSRME